MLTTDVAQTLQNAPADQVLILTGSGQAYGICEIFSIPNGPVLIIPYGTIISDTMRNELLKLYNPNYEQK